MKRSIVHEVWARAQSRCDYCQLAQQQDAIPFEIDHVIAESHGGRTTSENMALACFFDNNYKGTNLAGGDLITGQRRCSIRVARTGSGIFSGTGQFSSAGRPQGAQQSRYCG